MHKNIQDTGLQPMNDPLIIECPLKKSKYIVGSNSFPSICSIMLLILLLLSGLQLVKVTRDIYKYGIEGIFTLINNIVFVFSFMVVV